MSTITPERTIQLKHYIQQLNPGLLGKFAYYLLPFRKKVVLGNLKKVFGEILTPEEIVILAQAFYKHLCLSIKETFLLRWLSIEQLKKRVIIRGEEHMWKLLDEKVKGAILITGHFGSWEFAPIAGMLHFPEFKNRFYFVRKTLSFKSLEKILFHRYFQAGLQVIPKKNALDKVCAALENNNAVIFVLDQHASRNTRDGIETTFFGFSAGTYKSPAIIAQYTNVPVLSIRSFRQTDGTHVLEFGDKIPWLHCANEKEEIQINTQQFNKVLENYILDYPDQWMWMHKRWKNDL